MKLVDSFLLFDVERLRGIIRATNGKVKEIHVSSDTYDLFFEDCTVDHIIHSDAGGMYEKKITFEGIKVFIKETLPVGDVELIL